MDFESDPLKSEANKKKHGIDFVEAQVLWDDPDRLEIAAKTQDEARSVVIGQIQKNHWSAFMTYRGERVRIISVRRSRRKEIVWYES